MVESVIFYLTGEKNKMTTFKEKHSAGVISGDALQELLANAKQGGFALPAVNCTGTNTVNPAMETARDANAALIIQFSSGGAAFFAGKGLDNAGQRASIAGAISAAEHIHRLAGLYGAYIILHTDHCPRKTLPWLDGLLEAMRVRRHMLKSGLAHVMRAKGLVWRHAHDEAGDAAIAAVFFMPTEQQTADVVAALRAENIGAGRLWQTGGNDMHVYAGWTPVMQQRSWGSRGGPWDWAQRKIEYHPDMCAHSLDLLSRAVHLNISPLLSNEDVEETIEGVTRVLSALA